MDKVLDQIEAMKANWMTGASTEACAPDGWNDLDEVSRLALAGQFIRIATQPNMGQKAHLRSEIPELEHPQISPDVRALFRRAMQLKSTNVVDVVQFIADRGFAVNPIDWMPSPNLSKVPAIYDPWMMWGADGTDTSGAIAILSAETWDIVPRNSRYDHLEKLHRDNPAAARDLVEKVAPTMPADQRLRLLTCLTRHLTADDAPLLKTFAKDRSAKVQALVEGQLSRLGLQTASNADAVAEVTDFFQIGREGFLKRKKTISAKPLKNRAQIARRSKVLSQLTVSDTAAALGETADSFVEMWDLKETVEDISEMVVLSGTNPQIDRLAMRLVEAGSWVPNALMDRVSPETRSAVLHHLLATEDLYLSNTQLWWNSSCDPFGVQDLKQFRALSKLVDAAHGNDDKINEKSVEAALNFLGLALDRNAATSLLDRLTAAGLMAVDPRLTLLRLNAAL